MPNCLRAHNLRIYLCISQYRMALYQAIPGVEPVSPARSGACVLGL